MQNAFELYHMVSKHISSKELISDYWTFHRPSFYENV